MEMAWDFFFVYAGCWCPSIRVYYDHVVSIYVPIPTDTYTQRYSRIIRMLNIVLLVFATAQK